MPGDHPLDESVVVDRNRNLTRGDHPTHRGFRDRFDGGDFAGREAAGAHCLEIDGDKVFGAGKLAALKERLETPDVGISGLGRQLLIGDGSHERLVGFASRFGIVPARSDERYQPGPIVIEVREESN
jgi:hypothetical protein